MSTTIEDVKPLQIDRMDRRIEVRDAMRRIAAANAKAKEEGAARDQELREALRAAREVSRTAQDALQEHWDTISEAGDPTDYETLDDALHSETRMIRSEYTRQPVCCLVTGLPVFEGDETYGDIETGSMILKAAVRIREDFP